MINHQPTLTVVKKPRLLTTGKETLSYNNVCYSVIAANLLSFGF